MPRPPRMPPWAHWPPPSPVRRFLPGHLGSSVSALVDGQLDERTAERAWQHVSACPPCRRLVEHEGWVKRQLSHIAEGPGVEGPEPPAQLVGSLLGLDPAAATYPGFEDYPGFEAPGRSRLRVGLVLAGAGSVSAAVLGLGVSGAFSSLGDGTPATSIGGSHATPTRATPARVTLSPAGVPGRLQGDRTPARAHGDRR